MKFDQLTHYTRESADAGKLLARNCDELVGRAAHSRLATLAGTPDPS